MVTNDFFGYIIHFRDDFLMEKNRFESNADSEQ